MVTDLHSDKFLSAVGFPSGPLYRATGAGGTRKDSAIERRLTLAARWLSSTEVFERSYDVVTIDPRAEILLVVALQASVREKLAKSGIAVEVNPSSNLLIGQLSDLGDHPLWRLSPVPADPSMSPILLCIGTDNPLTFATDLRSEYQLLHDAVIRRGGSVAEADAWIDRIRDTGLAMRFTLPANPMFNEVTERFALASNPRLTPPP